MTVIEESIEVDVPLGTAYDQWTQFEDVPMFMDGISEVRQLDGTHLHWVAESAGRRYEWDAEITERKPDERVAWRSVERTENAAVVTFPPARRRTDATDGPDGLRPEGLVEQFGDVLGVPHRRVRGDLQRFKEIIEGRGLSSGGWRGTVKRPDER